MSRADADWRDYDEPRYVLFPATNNGRDLSAQVQTELDSGLASDCSGLYIEDTVISNPVKTGEPGSKRTFERVLHMKRPDFSGFEYSTILCLDNPDREFHPQGGSVIPGSFPVPDPPSEREGEVREYDVAPDEGAAHLFSGDLFADVRGGGFVYTNEDSLSVGTVFDLDSLVAEAAEPHELLDGLLTHPLLADWLDDYDEREYAAKLVPDSKTAALNSPHEGRLLVVGDAAGQMQAQGPIIKGMNHAVTAGALAAEAFAEARSRGDTDAAGDIYAEKLRNSGTMSKLRPTRYEVTRTLGEHEAVTNVADAVLESSVGRAAVRALGDRIESLYASPFLASMAPDTKTPYVTLPRVVAEELGDPVTTESTVEPPSLADRIGELTYDTDVGNPHIELLDTSVGASGAAVAACPVSAHGFGGGCYREETIKTDDGGRQVVSLDTQPCVECGTCAVVADTDWRHPKRRQGRRVQRGMTAAESRLEPRIRRLAEEARERREATPVASSPRTETPLEAMAMLREGLAPVVSAYVEARSGEMVRLSASELDLPHAPRTTG
jgi:ferredoxin-like protein FixX